MEQTTLPKEKELESPNRCAWCGEPSVDVIELEPARYKQTKQVDPETGKHVRVMRKGAIVAKVCDYHLKNLKLNGKNNEERAITY
jgi:hypothetical protein